MYGASLKSKEPVLLRNKVSQGDTYSSHVLVEERQVALPKLNPYIIMYYTTIESTILCLYTHTNFHYKKIKRKKVYKYS